MMFQRSGRGTNIYRISEKENRPVKQLRFYIAVHARCPIKNMKRITLTLLLAVGFTLSGIGKEKPAASEPSTDNTAADNTARNERDRSGDTKTSGDQSNSAEDIKITAAIRRAVVGDKSLSITAKNVKIITVNGVVTLRGPVNNPQERATIVKLAQSAGGKAKINNQLEVKASK